MPQGEGKRVNVKGDLEVDINKFYAMDGEKPLDNLVSDGGFCGIFRTMGIIGDSYASGELESYEEGIAGFHDFYEYSWGQFMAETAFWMTPS